jgi:hypothetical protein
MRSCLKWCVSIGVICIGVVLTGAIDQTTRDALKVKHLLRTIEIQSTRTDGKNLAAEVTEKELNAYIAYSLEQEKSALVNTLHVGLMDNNHIRGKVRFDAKLLNFGGFLGEDLDFDFTGILYTRNGAARLDLTEVWLSGQPVDPQLLDSIVKTAALNYGTESGGIEDWYEMPKGIKRADIHKGRAVLHY